MKEFEWFERFEWFEWFGPSPMEPFNSGLRDGGGRVPPLGRGVRRSPRRLAAMLDLTQLSKYQLLSNFEGLVLGGIEEKKIAGKYALESSRRDPQNALRCTILVGSVWVKTYTKINIAVL